MATSLPIHPHRTPMSTSQTVSLATVLLMTLSHHVTAQSLSSSSTGGSNSTTTDTSTSSDTIRDIILIVIIAILALANLIITRQMYRLWRDRDEVAPAPDGVITDENTKKNWKIDYNDLEVGEAIGTGQIGKVYKAKWRGLSVVVKEIQHSAKEEQVQEELSQLIKVRHPTLCLFMGVAYPSPEKMCIISEYMGRGNLYTVLHDKSLKLDWKKRMSMALDAARAMNYLHCCKPSILHKGLNSINILVDKELVAKISDYGLDNVRSMAKKSGVYTQPLWIAPEIFKKGKPTKASDVYSFGIILWEILTRKTPYQGKIKASNNVKAIKDITNGMRPQIPPKTPPKIVELMQNCWHADPSKRPSFQQVVDTLVELDKEKVDVAQFAEVEVKVEGDTPDTWRQSSDRKPWMINWDEMKLEEIIGHGSFGEVWSGTFRGKKVAIKKLTNVSKNHFTDFIHELNIMCSLRHPNTVLFMGACLEEGHMAIVMEYCEKGNLFEILHDVSQPIDYNQIIKILTEIAEGVLYLHLNQPPILHRDLKSLNILVDEDWNVKVSDFGLTDFKPDIDRAANLQLGTPFWLAPECMEHSEFSEASDVYSFGMIVWEMFTREIPFPNMNPHQAALAVITEDKRPDIPAFVPPKFTALIEDCWVRDPKKRPGFPEIIQRLGELKAEGLPRIELSLANAQLYRKKTAVFAFKSKDAVIVYKPWGTGEGKKGDWVLVGPNDDVYTCDAAIFIKTYSQIDPERPHLYRKTGKIFAKCMERDFLMQTLEGMEHGSKGDWIAQNPVDTEQWPIAAKTFAEMYELHPDQTIDDAPRPALVTPLTLPSKKVQPIDEHEKGLTEPLLSSKDKTAWKNETEHKKLDIYE